MYYGSQVPSNYMYGIAQVDKIYQGTEIVWENIRFHEDVVYDNTNIAIEFTTLVSTDIDLETTKATPDMTSNNTPTGICSSSSDASVDVPPWKAFSGINISNLDSWVSVGKVSEWIQYEFPTAIDIYKYEIVSRAESDTGTSAPKDWTLLGSNTGAFSGEEVLLDTQTGIVYNALDQLKEFSVTTVGVYKYYRVHITLNNGHSTTIGIGSLNYYGSSNILTATGYDGTGIALDRTDGTTVLKGVDKIEADFTFTNISTATVADTLTTDSPITDGDNLIIIKDDDSINEFVASGVVVGGDGSLNPSVDTLVPLMTSDALPSGLAFATNTHGSAQTYQAFDRGSLSWISAGVVYPIRLGYISDISYLVNKYLITGAVTVARSPNTWELQGSNDTTTGLDGTWDTLDSRSGEVWGGSEEKTFTFTASASYKAYRINITANNGDTFIEVIEFKLISDSYTMDTIAVTAGEIPSRVYTVDAQPSFAISAGYVDAVKLTDSYSLVPIPADVQVIATPIMTSNTAPSGEVIFSGNGFPGWWAFERLYTLNANKWTNGGFAGEAHIGFDFKTPTTIGGFRVFNTENATQLANSSLVDFELQGSDDGVGWTSLKTVVGESWTAALDNRYYDVDNIGTYNIYRLHITKLSGTQEDAIVMELELYTASEALGTSNTYDKVLDATGSLTVSAKMTLKSVGDKMTRMIFSTLR